MVSSNSSWRRMFMPLAALLIQAACLFMPVYAGIDESFDWVNDAGTGMPKRMLKVFYDFDIATAKLGDKKLSDIMDDAIQNWNDVKADTGWEFMGGGTEAMHDIRIKIDPAVDLAGGAETTGFPAAGGANRRVSELTVTFDPTPPGYKWDAAGMDKDKTKNPISTAKHELSHTLRLDHQGGTRSVTGKLKDPQGSNTKDDDVIVPSADDKMEAKTASTAAIKVAAAPAAPGNAAHLVVPGFPFEIPFPVLTPDMTLDIPGNAFLFQGNVLFSRTSLLSMPKPFDTDGSVDRMLKGVHIDFLGSLGPPQLSNSLSTITIPYEDGTEGEGFLVEVADPDYGSILESSLSPYFFDPLSGIWRQLNPFLLGGSYSLDTINDVAHITLPSTFLASLPNLSDPNTATMFLSIAGVTIPEPSTIMLLLAGITIAGLYRRSRRRGASGDGGVEQPRAMRHAVFGSRYFVGLVTGALTTAPLALEAEAELVYKTWTLKNASTETADDLHVVVTNLAGTVVESVSKARSNAFDDPPKGEGTATLDWPKMGGGGTVPPGLSDKIAICNEDSDFTISSSNRYFTKGGTALATLYITHDSKWGVDEDGDVKLTVTNPNEANQGALLIKRLDVFTGNDLENYSIDVGNFVYENPSGSHAFGLMNHVLNQGDSLPTIDLGPIDVMSHYALVVSTVAPANDPSNEFFLASGFSTIPEPSTLVAAVILATALGMLRRG